MMNEEDLSGRRITPTLAGEAKDQAADLAGQARRGASALMGEQKDRAARKLSHVAGALREVARSLGRDEIGQGVGRYANRAADRMETMSSYVRESDLQTMLQDTRQFARRRPEIFLGGILLAGLLAARFLKASGDVTSQRAPRPGGR